MSIKSSHKKIKNKILHKHMQKLIRIKYDKNNF